LAVVVVMDEDEEIKAIKQIWQNWDR
jgi:hypothetical protein